MRNALPVVPGTGRPLCAGSRCELFSELLSSVAGEERKNWRTGSWRRYLMSIVSVLPIILTKEVRNFRKSCKLGRFSRSALISSV
jgi:hypothetical protein